MHAKAYIRTAISIPASAAVIAGTLVAPEFAFCATRSDMPVPGLDDYLACDHSAGEYVFTLAILLLAQMAVAVIVARSVRSRHITAGLLASASSILLAMVMLQVLFNQPLKQLLDVSMIVSCFVCAAIGGVTAWASNRWWPVEPRGG